jgi:hypothetical protein
MRQGRPTAPGLAEGAALVVLHWARLRHRASGERLLDCDAAHQRLLKAALARRVAGGLWCGPLVGPIGARAQPLDSAFVVKGIAAAGFAAENRAQA